MAIVLHDTLAGAKRTFEPLVAGRVTMYLCGPTVYNYAHIGNARPAVVFDVLARLLRSRYELTFARNLTDVDDKINAAALESGKPISAITERFIEAYNQDLAGLHVAPPDIEPRATEHIGAMIAMIERLIAAGNAYVADGHVLFEVSTYKDYGALSRRRLSEMIAGARVEVAPYKRAAPDFVLWKPSTEDLPGWDSPWGRGRPGWHIECSAMCLSHLGPTIDIHCGGQDLVFPHHENEVAQSRCASGGAPLARFWLHNGFLNVEREKMSKSLGNFMLIRELLELHRGEVVRLALLSAHYRQPLEWGAAGLADAKKRLDRFYSALRLGGMDDSAGAAPPTELVEALEDDINTPRALAALFDLARAINRSDQPSSRRELAARLRAGGELLGLLQMPLAQWFGSEAGASAERPDIAALVAERDRARESKDYEQADRLRIEIEAQGYVIEDGPKGARWRRKD